MACNNKEGYSILESSTNQKKEEYYNRNILSLIMEGFFFTLALSMFSHENILPLYVSNISDKKIYIALITAIYFGFSYVASIFSSVMGVKSKSPKKILVLISLMQRVSFIFMYLSTYIVTENLTISLIIFFLVYTIYSISAGMSNPVFTQLVSHTVHRGTGRFFGLYSMAGSMGGLLASYIIREVIIRFDYPLSFRILFLIGSISGILSTFSVIIGVKEVTDDRVIEYIKLSQVKRIFIEIFNNNFKFKKVIYIRVLLSMTEFAIPYYLLFSKNLYYNDEKFISIMAAFFLISKTISSLLLGKLADIKGSLYTMKIVCLLGLVGSVICLILHSKLALCITYSLIAASNNGALLCTNVACIEYSNNVRTPFYISIIFILCAPVSIFMPFIGALLINAYSYEIAFLLVAIVYTIVYLIAKVDLKPDQQ